ncbi:retrotransposon protein, putative, ty1-copia subclass [Tanacetum coccineum]|uniref:Retrotransposon protein, putative, ty1-copia subclass n=1 Tax=Tanacetum coccineum TaxID=301880 RepID=A0ABQ5H6M6_9ASTR
MWKGKRPSFRHIKIWGCEVFVRREAQDKLEARSKKCLFVGYPEESFGYLSYKPKNNVVFVARRGVFLEREMIYKENCGSKIDLKEIQESADEEPIMNTDTQQEVVTLVEPDDISLPIRRTSSRVSTRPDLKTVGLAKIKLIRIRLTIAAFHDYEIWQMDVKTVFLNGKLIKDAFMAQLEGFENAKYPKRVYKLQKAIYGLKRLLIAGIFASMRKSHSLDFVEAKMSPVYMSKSVGVL